MQYTIYLFRYFEMKKHAAVKEQKTLDASTKVLFPVLHLINTNFNDIEPAHEIMVIT